jgi:hypothetical protein
MIAAEQKLFD